MKNTSRLLMASMAIGILSAPTVQAADPPTKTITLALKRLPKKEIGAKPALAGIYAERPVRIDVVDARTASDPLVVGAQTEKSNTVYIWKSDAPIASAVSRLAGEILRGWSLTVAPDSPRALAIRLTRYEVLEKSETIGSFYKAQVALEAQLVDGDGRTLSTSVGEGMAKQSGPDARASEVNDVLGTALRQALAGALAPATAAAAVPTPVAAAPAIPAPVAASPSVPPPAPAGITPAKLLEELSRLKAGGVGDSILLQYTKKQTLAAPLTADDILRWKEAGIPDAAIQAALDMK